MSIEEAAYDEKEEAARENGAAYTSASQNGNGASHQEAAPSSTSGQTGASDHGHIVPEVSDSSGGDSSLFNSVDDLDTMTVRDLKDRLKRAGLPISGRKSDLVGRLASNQGAK